MDIFGCCFLEVSVLVWLDGPDGWTIVFRFFGDGCGWKWRGLLGIGEEFH